MRYVLELFSFFEHLILGFLLGIYGGYLLFEYLHPSLGFAKDFVYCVGSQLP